MIDIENLSIQFTGEYLFDNANLKISSNDRIALVGSNGSGKTTLLKLISGQEDSETGNVNKKKNLKIGFLPQEFVNTSNSGLLNYIKKSIDEIKSIEEEEDLVNLELENDKTNPLLLERLAAVAHKKEDLDYFSFEAKIKRILSGLGFEETDFTRKINEFSGGWQMRVELAKLLAEENDLLLLDEPTNHLDIDSLGWLIDFLAKHKGSILIVSHDKHFVNNVTNKTFEIFNNKINVFNGNYDHYLHYKEERDDQLLKDYASQQREIKETQKFIDRFRYKSTKAKQVQSRVKQLEKIEIVELPDSESSIDIKFQEAPRSGVVPVELTEVKKCFGDLTVFEDISLQVGRGDKIAFVGPNGAGKTTLARIIAGVLDQDNSNGEIKIGHNTEIAYYAQEVANNIELDLSILDAVRNSSIEYTDTQLRTILGSFLFTNDDVFKKIKVLSGGEKSRVALSKILLTKTNFIVLDEPTNHLDISSKRILQKALMEFSGSLIIVSHDIDFLRPITNKIVEIRKNSFKLFHGDIDYYLFKQKELIESESVNSAPKEKKGNRKDQKRIEAEIRVKKHNATKELKKELEKIELVIEEQEELKNQLEVELTKDDIFSKPELLKKTSLNYDETKKTLEEAYNRWTEISEELEEIESQFN